MAGREEVKAEGSRKSRLLRLLRRTAKGIAWSVLLLVVFGGAVVLYANWLPKPLVREPEPSSRGERYKRYLSQRNPLRRYENAAGMIAREDSKIVYDAEFSAGPDAPSPAEVEAALERMQPAFQELAVGAACRAGDFEVPPDLWEWHPDIRVHLSPLIGLRRMALTDAERKFERGEVAAALDQMLDAAEMRSDVRSSHSFLATGLSLAYSPLGYLHKALVSEPLDASDYRRVARRLEHILAERSALRDWAPWAYREAWHYFVHHSRKTGVDRIISGVDHHESLLGFQAGGVFWMRRGEGKDRGLRLWLVPPTTRRGICARFNRHTRKVMAGSDESYEAMIRSAEKDAPEWDKSGRMMTWLLRVRLAYFVKGTAILRGVMALSAVKTYEAEKGGYPERLSNLVDEGLLERIPTDPYTGEPFKYRREGDGFTLYSVGPNAKDDGGLGKRQEYGWRVQKHDAVKSDLVFGTDVSPWNQQ